VCYDFTTQSLAKSQQGCSAAPTAERLHAGGLINGKLGSKTNGHIVGALRSSRNPRQNLPRNLRGIDSTRTVCVGYGYSSSWSPLCMGRGVRSYWEDLVQRCHMPAKSAKEITPQQNERKTVVSGVFLSPISWTSALF
jgi:hypothetical protein